MIRFMLKTACCALLLLLPLRLLTAAEPDSQGFDFFEQSVRPVLVNRCYECHSEDSVESGLRVDSLAALLKGGSRGPAIVPGEAKKSLLIGAINHSDQLQMPPKQKLSQAEISAIARWVDMGAPWPNSAQAIELVKAENPSPKAPFEYGEAEKKFWSFQEPVATELPAIQNDSWVQSPIDHFILSKLEAAKLKPAPAADKRTLIRRITIGLIGLPPTPDEVAAFLADDNSDAVARLVDRLLESPHYGERWGRHWLDVARYADSNGLDENLAFANAYRYRDYVIAAFNDDKPFDQFVQEQIAGDLLYADLPNDHQSQARKQAGLTATSFLVIGAKMLAEDDQVKMQMDIIDEQIDTIGRAFMGLTLGCARCHNHKFDPISIEDYYALAGIFKSTKTMSKFSVVAHWQERPLEMISILQLSGEEKSKLPHVMAVSEEKPENLRVHLRGSHTTLGAEVARRFPQILSDDTTPQINPTQSGRLELALWLTSGKHPLTARVVVNRIWQHHFGVGLVRSPDNFGKLGERPTHPELLDWLAVHFVEQGWSIKWLHRTIMQSAVYQMSTAAQAAAEDLDPENNLYWHRNRQRMEAEVLRDSLLAISGNLDRTMGGSLLPIENYKYVTNTGNKDPVKYTSNRRSVYLPVVRSALYNVFQAFDFAEPNVSGGKRDVTTVAPQALFMMNSELVSECTKSWAERLLADSTASDEERVWLAFLDAYARPATEAETAQALSYINEYKQALAEDPAPDGELTLRAWQSFCRVMLAANEFVYVE